MTQEGDKKAMKLSNRFAIGAACSAASSYAHGLAAAALGSDGLYKFEAFATVVHIASGCMAVVFIFAMFMAQVDSR